MTQDLIKKILPEKMEVPEYCEDYQSWGNMGDAYDHGYERGEVISHNSTIDQCAQSLTKAFADGVICEVPSVQRLTHCAMVGLEKEGVKVYSWKDRDIIVNAIHELLRKAK